MGASLGCVRVISGNLLAKMAIASANIVSGTVKEHWWDLLDL